MARAPKRATLSAIERLAIYRDSSRRALERTLEVIYAVCRQILGPRCFTRLAADYIDAFASRHGDLNRYGANFARHLAAVQRQQPALATLAYLPDLAHLEWHWHAIYYAPDDPPPDAAALAPPRAAGAGRAGAAAPEHRAPLSDFALSDRRDLAAPSRGRGHRANHRRQWRSTGDSSPCGAPAGDARDAGRLRTAERSRATPRRRSQPRAQRWASSRPPGMT